MRPTGIGFRSPRERTPAFYTTHTNQKMEGMFSPVPSKTRQIEDFARQRKGFGMADRFLYVRMKERLATCQPNLGPANYDDGDQFKAMAAIPCTSIIKTLGISKEEQVNYKYVGQSLVYDPLVPVEAALDQTRLALPENRGIFSHPAMRPISQGGTMRVSKTPRHRLANSQSSASHSKRSGVVKHLPLNQVFMSGMDSSDHALLETGSRNTAPKSYSMSRKPSHVSHHQTSLTARGGTAANSPQVLGHITKETDCGHKDKFYQKNIFMSPKDDEDNEQDGCLSSSGMRKLPRFSASEAVGNFRDIYSERAPGNKYRHVSNKDFMMNSADPLHKGVLQATSPPQSDALTDGTQGGFSSITPLENAQRRKYTQQGKISTGRRTMGIAGEHGTTQAETINHMATGKERSVDDTGSRAMRSSQKSVNNSIHSRGSKSIRSLRSRGQRSRVSGTQTNDMYVVGSMDNIQINYKVDVDNQRVESKPTTFQSQ